MEVKKRGRPQNTELDIFELKRKLREIALNTDELLNPNKLEKLTGIERRNWNKVAKEIEAVNHIRIGNITPGTAKDYPLPNTEEVFTLYGHDVDKLKGVFQSLINLVSKMWEKSLSYDNTRIEYQQKLAEKDRRIEKLLEQLKQAKEDNEFHKIEYRRVCGESSFRDKRKELEIPNNVVNIKKGDKSIMDIDMEDLLNDVLGTSEKIVVIKKDD